jgi:hypothetical protein
MANFAVSKAVFLKVAQYVTHTKLGIRNTTIMANR